MTFKKRGLSLKIKLKKNISTFQYMEFCQDEANRSVFNGLPLVKEMSMIIIFLIFILVIFTL